MLELLARLVQPQTVRQAVHQATLEVLLALVEHLVHSLVGLVPTAQAAAVGMQVRVVRAAQAAQARQLVCWASILAVAVVVMVITAQR